jgi:hypothetical protein
MDASTLKKEITGKVNKILSPEILENLDAIVNDLLIADQGKDFWDDLPESVKKNIAISQQEIKEGKTIPHETVMKEAQQWLKK